MFYILQNPEEPDGPILQLIQDVSTRWNLTYSMLERALKLRGSITRVLEMEEWSAKIDVKFRDRDWETIQKVVSVLEVIFIINYVFPYNRPLRIFTLLQNN